MELDQVQANRSSLIGAVKDAARRPGGRLGDRGDAGRDPGRQPRRGDAVGDAPAAQRRAGAAGAGDGGRGAQARGGAPGRRRPLRGRAGRQGAPLQADAEAYATGVVAEAIGKNGIEAAQYQVALKQVEALTALGQGAGQADHRGAGRRARGLRERLPDASRAAARELVAALVGLGRARRSSSGMLEVLLPAFVFLGFSAGAVGDGGARGAGARPGARGDAPDLRAAVGGGLSRRCGCARLGRRQRRIVEKDINDDAPDDAPCNGQLKRRAPVAGDAPLAPRATVAEPGLLRARQ